MFAELVKPVINCMKAHNKFRKLSSKIFSKINCIVVQHEQEIQHDSRPIRNLNLSTSPMPVPSTTDVAEVTSTAELPGTAGTTCPMQVPSTEATLKKKQNRIEHSYVE